MKQKMGKAETIERLKPFVEKPDECGFEAYLVSKSEPRLKRLNLSINDLHYSLKTDIIGVIRDTYLAEDATYSGVENAGDVPGIFYIIEQTDEYKPFDVETWKIEDFKEEQIDELMGFFFVFRYEHQRIWCYQNRRSTTVTNRRKTGLLARLCHYDSGWVFEEQNDKIISFAHTVDIVLIDGMIITSDIRLLERSFDFQKFIYQRAMEAAESVAATRLFGGMDKLDDYLSSNAKI